MASNPLALFKTRAKIDFITISLPAALKNHATANNFLNSIKGKVMAGNNSFGGWITIHDPERSDLQYLIDNFPNVEIQTLEVAIDFTLKDRSNNREILNSAHHYLAINLFPQGHQRLRTARRKIFTPEGIRLDTLKTETGGGTVYWSNAMSQEQVRLYVKTHDNKLAIDQHSTRLEITLSPRVRQLNV